MRRLGWKQEGSRGKYIILGEMGGAGEHFWGEVVAYCKGNST